MHTGWLPIVDLSAGLAAPGAGADIISDGDIANGWASAADADDIQVPAKYHGCTLRFFICMENASVIQVVDDTGTVLKANNAVAVGADAGHTFDLIASKDRSYNIAPVTDGIVRYLMVVAVWGASV